MIKLGQYNTLVVERMVEFGIYLVEADIRPSDEEYIEILMPRRYVPDGTKVGDELDVFVYQDSEARLIATNETPLATVGETAPMRIMQVNRVGAFADWGVSKQLLIPYRQQEVPMVTGGTYLIRVYVDEKTGRLCGTSKLTDKPEKNLNGQVRRQMTYSEQLQPAEQQIIKMLCTNKGFLPLSDNSDPDEIQAMLHMSKKTFKRAIGALYRERRIVIQDGGISLSEE